MASGLEDVLAYERALWAQGWVVAGLDEAGRGAWAGPVVAAAVILPSDEQALRHLAEVDDSKRLTPAARERLFTRIQQVAQVGIGVIAPQRIDEIGILAATYEAMTAALQALPRSPDTLLIDYLPRALGDWPQQRLVRGESQSLSIAAASIVAKVHRDRLMMAYDQTYPGYGFARHKGYGTRQHRQALARLGPTPIHRLSWAPLRQPSLPFDDPPSSNP